MNNINFWKHNLPWTWHPYNWWNHIRTFFRQVKWSYQRVTRGYSDWDWWDLDSFYTHLIIDSLTHFRDNTNSYPTRYDSIEEWKDELTHIIEEFVLSVDESKYTNNYEDEFDKMPRDWNSIPDVNKPYWDYIRQQYINAEKVNVSIMRQHRQTAFVLLNNCYDDLWD